MNRFSIPATPEMKIIEISRFTGIDLNPDITQIDSTKSPEMINMVLDQDGTPEKRPGYRRLFEPLEDIQPINGLFYFQDRLFIARGTKLYLWDNTDQEDWGDGRPSHMSAPEDRELSLEYSWQDDVSGWALIDYLLSFNQLTEIYDGLANDKVRGFEFADKLYLLDGTHYLVYDGLTVEEVTPYVPTLTISTPHTGGGVSFEALNLLTFEFKQSFNGQTGEATYKLLFPLDPTYPVTVELLPQGTTLNQGAHLTVNHAAGTLAFVPGHIPPSGLNNVIIRARKAGDSTETANLIKKCRFASIYGGRNDTRVHLYGNPDEADILFRCGLTLGQGNPAYWPEGQFSRFGTSSTAITGAVLQYESHVIFKEDSIYLQHFELEGVPFTTDPAFPSKPINSRVGCIAPDSLQVVENNPIFLSPSGVMMLVSSQVRDERNVVLLSEAINPDLLRRDLEKANSVYHDGNYILVFPDGYTWVYNTRVNVSFSGGDRHTGAWYPWDNVFARVLLSANNRTLYFGTDAGLVQQFYTHRDSFPYNDDGELIHAYWTTKVFGFEAESYYKMIKRLHCTLRPGSATGLEVYFRTDRGGIWEHLTNFFATLINYQTMSYADWTYFSNILPQAIPQKLKAKKVVYFQLRFENKENNMGMGLLYLALHYQIQRGVK